MTGRNGDNCGSSEEPLSGFGQSQVVFFGCGYLATTTALWPGGHVMRLFALQSGQDTSMATSGVSVLITSFITLNGAAQAMQSKSRSNFCLPFIRRIDRGGPRRRSGIWICAY